jgi:ribosomal protein S18 acetylase RimI-like enzyme
VVATLAPRKRSAAAGSVRTLRPADVTTLRLPGMRSGAALREALDRYPERSVWVPETLEYLVLAPWRHRPEIAYVEELVGVRHSEALLQGAYERCLQRGDELLLAIELESERRPTRYERAGLTFLEEVVTYEIDTARAGDAKTGSLAVERVTGADEPAITLLTTIDHEAFPWLWRNSREEFQTYLRTPGALVGLVSVSGEAVGYFGATLYTGWGHLDRIAIAPRYQGRGFGTMTLHAAVTAMRRQGARRLGLSTQRTNIRSQRLYERFGFRHTPGLDYQLFGRWCRPDCAPADPA